MCHSTVRIKVEFQSLSVGDRVAVKTRRGATGGAIASLVKHKDGSLIGFRLEGERNPSVYYQKVSFIAGYRHIEEKAVVHILAYAGEKIYDIELDHILKENDNIEIAGKKYYVYGTPVLVLKESAWTDGGYKLNYQQVNLELRS